MEGGYLQIMCHYSNSNIGVTNTCYPCGTKFCGLAEDQGMQERIVGWKCQTEQIAKTKH